MSDLTPGQNKRLREAMWAARRERFDDNVTALAKAMGRAQPSISDFMNGKGGASYETARRFAAIVDTDVQAVIGEPEEVEEAPAADENEGLPQVLVEATRFARANKLPESVIADYARTHSHDGFAGAMPEELYVEMKAIAQQQKRGAIEPDASDELEAERTAAMAAKAKKKKGE